METRNGTTGRRTSRQRVASTAAWGVAFAFIAVCAISCTNGDAKAGPWWRPELKPVQPEAAGAQPQQPAEGTAGNGGAPVSAPSQAPTSLQVPGSVSQVAALPQEALPEAVGSGSGDWAEGADQSASPDGGQPRRGAAPAPTAPAATTGQLQAHEPEAIVRAERGDSIERIAGDYGVSPEALAAANGLSPQAWLTHGQRLRMPSGLVRVVRAQRGASLRTLARAVGGGTTWGRLWRMNRRNLSCPRCLQLNQPVIIPGPAHPLIAVPQGGSGVARQQAPAAWVVGGGRITYSAAK